MKKVLLNGVYDEEGKLSEYTSMLEAMKDNRIFEIGMGVKDQRFIIEEACDNHFRVTLTKDQLLQLAEEIKALGLK